MPERGRNFVNVIALATLFSLTTKIGIAQPWGALTNHHRIVVDHLIHLYTDLTNQISARNAADPSLAASRLQGAMSLFGLSPAGYQIMGSIISGAKGQLDTVREAQSKYVTGLVSSAPPSAAVRASLQTFYDQQTAILQQVPIDLKAKLDAADWGALQTFVSAELTAKIKVAKVTDPLKAPPIRPTVK